MPDYPFATRKPEGLNRRLPAGPAPLLRSQWTDPDRCSRKGDPGAIVCIVDKIRCSYRPTGVLSFLRWNGQPAERPESHFLNLAAVMAVTVGCDVCGNRVARYRITEFLHAAVARRDKASRETPRATRTRYQD